MPYIGIFNDTVYVPESQIVCKESIQMCYNEYCTNALWREH